MARIAARLLSNTTGGMMLRVALILAVLLGSPLALAADRVVSLGGSVTEIVYALGKQDSLIANDASSLYPAAAAELPKVGYYRSLSLEGILSQRPDLVLASNNAGPPEVLERLQSFGVAVAKVSDEPGIDSLLQRVGQIAVALDAPDEGQRLQQHIRDSVQRASHGAPMKRRAIIVLHRGGPLLAAGTGTSANALLELAGIENAGAGSRGYKPISDESLIALAPDMIITSSLSAESVGGLQAFSERPGVAATPAGQAGRVVAVDDLLLLGMGPRVAEAVTLLREAAH